MKKKKKNSNLVFYAQSTFAVISGRRIFLFFLMITTIIMHIYHALIDAISAQIHIINLNTVFLTHVEQSPTNAICTQCYLKQNNNTNHLINTCPTTLEPQLGK